MPSNMLNALPSLSHKLHKTRLWQISDHLIWFKLILCILHVKKLSCLTPNLMLLAWYSSLILSQLSITMPKLETSSPSINYQLLYQLSAVSKIYGVLFL